MLYPIEKYEYHLSRGPHSVQRVDKDANQKNELFLQIPMGS